MWTVWQWRRTGDRSGLVALSSCQRFSDRQAASPIKTFPSPLPPILSSSPSHHLPITFPSPSHQNTPDPPSLCPTQANFTPVLLCLNRTPRDSPVNLRTLFFFPSWSLRPFQANLMSVLPCLDRTSWDSPVNLRTLFSPVCLLVLQDGEHFHHTCVSLPQPREGV